MVVMEAALKILVVDDNPLIRCCMSFIFAASHYEVISARDGNDALARLDANPDGYDVIIVDQKMPQLSGVELVREIRKKGIRAKIMVLSAHLSPEIREAYEQLNVPVILDKPFNIQDLRLVVDRLAA
jgi:CheY-like chemotaxis protein